MPSKSFDCIENKRDDPCQEFFRKIRSLSAAVNNCQEKRFFSIDQWELALMQAAHSSSSFQQLTRTRRTCHYNRVPLFRILAAQLAPTISSPQSIFSLCSLQL